MTDGPVVDASKAPTMAELEALEHRRQANRRSVRQSNFRIKTVQFSRLHEIFWKGDSIYDNDGSLKDDDDDDNESNEGRSDGSPTKKKRKCSSSSLTLQLTRIFGKQSWQKVHDSPHIYVMDNFLNERQLEYCQSKIQKTKFNKSVVDKASGDSVVVEQQRTSTFLSLQKMEHSAIAAMERRAAELLGMTVQQLEPLQLVRYEQGQFFGLHHDMGVLFEDGSVELPPKKPWAKRRLVTIFVYLNNVASGGCTHFSLLNLRIQPKRGRAVLFCNIDKHGMPDPRTVHCGEPVTQGSIPNMANCEKKQTPEEPSKGGGVLDDPNVKYGINIWACEE